MNRFVNKELLMLAVAVSSLGVSISVTALEPGEQNSSIRSSPKATESSANVEQSVALDQAKINPDWTWDKISVSVIKTTQGGSFNYALTKQDGKWVIVRGDDSRKAFATEAASFERLSFDSSTMKLSVRFDNLCQLGQHQSNIICSCARGLISESNRKNGYTLCSSELKTAAVNPFSAIGSIAASVMTLGTSTSIWYKLDEDSILAAAKEANLLDAINRDNYERYLADFQKAQQSSKTIKTFIAKVRSTNYDPDNLADTGEKMLSMLTKREEDEALAKTKRDADEALDKQVAKYRLDFENASSARQLQDFIDQYQQFDPNNLVSQAKKKLVIAVAEEKKAAEQSRREAIARQNALLARLNSWRKALKVGDDTNCGPVLEFKANLIKIYFPVRDYGNEHWIRRDQVFPSDSGCKFINGSYQPS